jgi:catalase
MPYESAAYYRFNPFDVTKVWPHADFPPIAIGRLVLDRNLEKFFAEVEQAAFAPANLVPGIAPQPGQDADGADVLPPRHATPSDRRQLQPAADQRPRSPVHAYDFDGPMRYRHSGPEQTYAPNSYGCPQADPQRAGEPTRFSDAAELGHYAYERHAADDDFGQAGALVRDVMTDADRDHLVDHLSQGVSGPIQNRAIDYWTCVDAPLGERVAAGLGWARVAAA